VDATRRLSGANVQPISYPTNNNPVGSNDDIATMAATPFLQNSRADPLVNSSAQQAAPHAPSVESRIGAPIPSIATTMITGQGYATNSGGKKLARNVVADSNVVARVLAPQLKVPTQPQSKVRNYVL
jgi:hypothetical protein